MSVPLKTVMVVSSEPSGRGNVRGGPALTALEPVANRPILYHVLDGLREPRAGSMIIAGEADALLDVRASLRDYRPALDQLDYAICHDFGGIASTLSAVAGLVGDSPCLIQPADGLLDRSVKTLVDMLEHGPTDLLLVMGPGDDSFASEDSDGDGGSTSLQGQGFADVGVFGPGALARVTEQAESLPMLDLATAGRSLAAHGSRVRWHAVDGWCRYRGHPRDLLELNRIALDRLSASVPAAARLGNRIEGRALIDPTAIVKSSVIIGPTAIGPRAEVIDAYIGPYTSIGADSRIEGVEVERSIVSPGASVMHLGARVVSSVVGRDARVFRDFSLPRALRLWVGDGDEVAVC